MEIKQVGKYVIYKIGQFKQVYGKNKMIQTGNGKKIIVDLTKNKIVKDVFERSKNG